jgi:hypothetical protein
LNAPIIAETAVAQTRDAYDRSQVALDASIATFESSFDTAGRSATAFNRKIIDLARRNIDSVFDLAESLSNAKNLTEIVELQAAYWQKQFSLLSAQAREVGTLSKLTDAAVSRSRQLSRSDGKPKTIDPRSALRRSSPDNPRAAANGRLPSNRRGRGT